MINDFIERWLFSIPHLCCSCPLQVKAAFTRAYNKEVHLTPYSLQTVKKGRRGGGGGLELGGEDGDADGNGSEDEGEELQTDAMIKVSSFRLGQRYQLLINFITDFCGSSLQQKKTKITKESKKEKKEDSGKGKGKGKGKAKKWQTQPFLCPNMDPFTDIKT